MWLESKSGPPCAEDLDFVLRPAVSHGIQEYHECPCVVLGHPDYTAGSGPEEGNIRWTREQLGGTTVIQVKGGDLNNVRSSKEVRCKRTLSSQEAGWRGLGV